MIKSFYGSIYSAKYDLNEGRSNLLTFYLNQWDQMGRTNPVLEPMSGTGFFLIPFKEAGADIDGLDASPHMITVCQKKCAAKKIELTLYQQTLEEMNLPRRYNFMFIPDRSFGHIHEKEAAQTALKHLFDHLLPGGGLVLDIALPSMKEKYGKPGEHSMRVEDLEDGSVLWTTSLWSEQDEGRVSRCLAKQERFMDTQLVETELFDYHERFYSRQEMIEMLQHAGFTEIKATGEQDTIPQDALVYTCRKPADSSHQTRQRK